MADTPTVDAGMSSAEYLALAARGVLAEAEVELIDGLVFSMTPLSDEHAAVIQRMTGLLATGRGDLHVQLPLHLADDSVPEPDLALADRRGHRHPSTARLVVEVVVSQWDEAMRKLPVYAEAGVAECWIVDVPKRLVHVHDEPSGREFGRTRTFAGDDALEPPGTELRFTVADVFTRLDA